MRWWRVCLSIITTSFYYYRIVYLKKCENRPCCTLIEPRPGNTYLESLMDIQAALAKFHCHVTVPEVRFVCECSHKKERLLYFTLPPQDADEQCGVERQLEWHCPERPKKRKAPLKEGTDSKAGNKTTLRAGQTRKGSEKRKPWQETEVMPFDRSDPFYPEREDHYRRRWIGYDDDEGQYGEFGEPFQDTLRDTSESLNRVDDEEEEEDGADELDRYSNSWYRQRCGDPRHKTWCVRYKACTLPTLMTHMVDP